MIDDIIEFLLELVQLVCDIFAAKRLNKKKKKKEEDNKNVHQESDY